MTVYKRRKPPTIYSMIFWCDKHGQRIRLDACIARGERRDNGCIRCEQRNQLLKKGE